MGLRCKDGAASILELYGRQTPCLERIREPLHDSFTVGTRQEHAAGRGGLRLRCAETGEVCEERFEVSIGVGVPRTIGTGVELGSSESSGRMSV
jgi:hypothetical protein